MPKNYWRDAKIAREDVPLIEDIFERAPIWETAFVQPTNAGMRHVVERVKSADAAQVVELDGALPEITSDTSLEDVRIGAIGGIMKVGEDAAKAFGGAGKYFAKKWSPVLKQTGMDMEKSLVENSLLAYAIANGNVIDAGGTNSGGMTFILAVKWVEDETAVLYDPDGFNNGRMFDLLTLTKATGDLLTIDGSEKVGHAQRIKTYIGTLLKNPDNVAAIVNIDLTADSSKETGYAALPTEAMMDDLGELTYSEDGNTVFYMTPKCQNRLGVYKGGKLEMLPESEDFRRRFSSWEETAIATSRNIPSDKATITV